MQGETEFSARFHFIFDEDIPATTETLLGPIATKFVIPGCNASGFNIKGLCVINEVHLNGVTSITIYNNICLTAGKTATFPFGTSE
jgi:hypothetical protein